MYWNRQFCSKQGADSAGFGASCLRFCARMVLFYFSFLSYNVRESNEHFCSIMRVTGRNRGTVVMAVQYRKLTENDLDTFIEMRIRQLREEGATEEIDLKPALFDYYKRHMADGTFVSWLAVDGEKIVGTSGMSFVEKPPYFSCPSGKIGLLSSMYTADEHRRQGIAKALLTCVVEEAREYGCGCVQITASDMGVLLYTDFGFVKNGNFMQYKCEGKP